MKTTIITLAVVALLSIGNSFGSNKIYYNTEGSKETGTTITTAYNGYNDGNLTPTKQNVFQYNSDKSLKEKTTYKWNTDAKQWVASHKYTYEYNRAGQYTSISYAEWNKSTQSWNIDVKYTICTYDANGKLLSINYLDTKSSNTQLDLARNSY